jgi:uncharacterized membrane-anchored protein
MEPGGRCGGGHDILGSLTEGVGGDVELMIKTRLPEALSERTGAFLPPVARPLRGPVRLGRRTKELTNRLAPDAIVVLDHADLDAVAARALVRCRPAAIINCRPFVTGRYPNRGPGVLLDAGIPLFDLCSEGEPAPDLFAVLADGETATIKGDTLRRASGEQVSRLEPLTTKRLEAQIADARANLDNELCHFAQNTLQYLSRDEERALLLDPVPVPDLATPIAGLSALVVVRGDDYEEDLLRLGPYLREQRPVVIAVDGAADTLLANGIRPSIILGDMDSVSDQALRCGAELIVHAYTRRDREDEVDAPGMARIRALGLTAWSFPVGGTSEDAALLLAYEKGADLIVAVGTHTHLEDFLDKGRGGMASTFLVRLKVGSRLVDARGVSRLYTTRQRTAPLLLFLGLSALFPTIALAAATPWGQIAWRSIVVWFRLLFPWHL